MNRKHKDYCFLEISVKGKNFFGLIVIVCFKADIIEFV